VFPLLPRQPRRIATTCRPCNGTETWSPKTRSNRRSRRAILQLEAVEQRVVLSTVFVSPTGSLGGQPAFTTIQAGVNAAKAGDTVEVGSGTYNGNVAVNKPLTILGARANINPNQSTVITSAPTVAPAVSIIGIQPLPSVINGSFKVTANNVTLNGFTVENQFGTDVADADGVSGFRVVDDVIENAYLGVQLFADHAATVTDNLITGINGDGIDVGDRVTILVKSASALPVATNDVISANTFQHISYDGISLANTNSSQVTNNLIQNPREIGILMSNSNGNALLGNTVVGAGDDGIELVDSSNNALQSNQVQASGANGIEVFQGSGNLLTQNTVTQSGSAEGQGFLYQGILLSGTTNDSVLNNYVAYGYGAGIELNGTSGVVVDGNTATHNEIQGVEVENSSAITVMGNTLDSNLAQGIYLLNSSAITVTGNTADYNGYDGVLLISDTNCTVDGNQLLDNVGNNIALYSSTANQIEKNNASGATVDGIFLDAKSTGNTVSSNTALLNGHFDAEDDSTGNRTAGTANTWTGNIEVKDNHGGRL
jgi:parallel beta-helix repeat protein